MPPKESPLVNILRRLHLAGLAYRLREFFLQLLRVDALRVLVAAVRYVWFAVVCRRMRTLEPRTGDVALNTVHHNKRQVNSFQGFSVSRSNLLLYPLAAIRLTKSAPILSIGPRTEGELLNLLSLGFRNVRGLDLLSYSPWIDLGDMHAMPYADNAFSTVIMGWVIAYSDNRRKAALEAVRVVRSGGLIAVGAEFAKESAEEATKRLGYVITMTPLQSLRELLDLFAPHVDRVFFSHDLPSFPVDKWNIMAIFSVKK